VTRHHVLNASHLQQHKACSTPTLHVQYDACVRKLDCQLQSRQPLQQQSADTPGPTVAVPQHFQPHLLTNSIMASTLLALLCTPAHASRYVMESFARALGVGPLLVALQVSRSSSTFLRSPYATQVLHARKFVRETVLLWSLNVAVTRAQYLRNCNCSAHTCVSDSSGWTQAGGCRLVVPLGVQLGLLSIASLAVGLNNWIAAMSAVCQLLRQPGTLSSMQPKAEVNCLISYRCTHGAAAPLTKPFSIWCCTVRPAFASHSFCLVTLFGTGVRAGSAPIQQASSISDSQRCKAQTTWATGSRTRGPSHALLHRSMKPQLPARTGSLCCFASWLPWRP
jgi:hypothetical protein